jgi:hypothetical protein
MAAIVTRRRIAFNIEGHCRGDARDMASEQVRSQ